MRDYVHCYALHCLDVEQSNQLRKVYKDRGENVGAWCQACYYPLVSLARENEWDIDDLFNRNEKLRIWYVPTKLRQLCHIERIKHGEWADAHYTVICFPAQNQIWLGVE